MKLKFSLFTSILLGATARATADCCLADKEKGCISPFQAVTAEIINGVTYELCCRIDGNVTSNPNENEFCDGTSSAPASTVTTGSTTSSAQTMETTSSTESSISEPTSTGASGETTATEGSFSGGASSNAGLTNTCEEASGWCVCRATFTCPAPMTGLTFNLIKYCHSSNVSVGQETSGFGDDYLVINDQKYSTSDASIPNCDDLTFGGTSTDVSVEDSSAGMFDSSYYAIVLWLPLLLLQK